MTIADVFETSKHRENSAHFTAIVNVAAVDGNINEKELIALQGFAKKLDISADEYSRILKHPDKQPCIAINSCEERLQHMYDFFKMVYADDAIEAPEKELVVKYAIGLGVPTKKAQSIVERSIKIFSGHFKFEEYKYLLNK